MNIIIFGPQGSGKGTQAEIISKKFNIPHISTGDIFRAKKKESSEEGKIIADLIDNGNLVPDDITNQLIEKRLQQSDAQAGFILDGYPRNMRQADFLDKCTRLDYAIEIFLNDGESVRRISNRRSCPKCNNIYHLIFNPPQNNKKCDKCKSKLIIRKDDKKRAILKRLKTYHSLTEPIINYYKEKNIYHQVDGAPQIKVVAKAILHILKM